MACAPSEDFYQPGHPLSLIRVFAVRLMGSQGPKLSSSGQRRLWSDWADAQADLSLRWAHMPFCWFLSRCGSISLCDHLPFKPMNRQDCFHRKAPKNSDTWNIAVIILKGHIATLYCDLPTEKVIFKGEQMHIRIWSNGTSTSLVCICRLCFFTYMFFQVENMVEYMYCLPRLTLSLWKNVTPLCTSWFNFDHQFKLHNNLLIG